MSPPDPVIIARLPLGGRAEIRVALDTFNGQWRCDVRTWADYRSGSVQMRGPTQKGVSAPVDCLPELADALARAVCIARERGMIPAKAEICPADRLDRVVATEPLHAPCAASVAD